MVDEPSAPGRRQAFFASVSVDVLIALRVIKGAMDSGACVTYVEHFLVPELEPGTVSFLHNLAMHKTAAAAKAILQLHRTFGYLALEFLGPNKLAVRMIQRGC